MTQLDFSKREASPEKTKFVPEDHFGMQSWALSETPQDSSNTFPPHSATECSESPQISDSADDADCEDNEEVDREILTEDYLATARSSTDFESYQHAKNAADVDTEEQQTGDDGTAYEIHIKKFMGNIIWRLWILGTAIQKIMSKSVPWEARISMFKFAVSCWLVLMVMEILIVLLDSSINNDLDWSVRDRMLTCVWIQTVGLILILTIILGASDVLVSSASSFTVDGVNQTNSTQV